jgi:hypothetical protein
MAKAKRVLTYISFLILFLCFSTTQSQMSLNIRKEFSEPIIWLEGTGMTPETTTVTLRITTSGGQDTLCTSKADVVLLLDNSGSMGQPGPPPTDAYFERLEPAISAAKEFIDSMHLDDRVAVMRYGRWTELDTMVEFTSGFSAAKDSIDSLMDGSGLATATYYSLYNAVHYAIYNARPGVVPTVIALTDGDESCSGDSCLSSCTACQDCPAFPGNNRDPLCPDHPGMQCGGTCYYQAAGTGPGLLGQSRQDAFDSLYNFVQEHSGQIKIYTIILGADTNSINTANTNLRQLAESTGGKYYYAPSGNYLSDIYNDINDSIPEICLSSNIVAKEVDTVNHTVPMVFDVLPGWIHYAPGSYRPSAGNTVNIMNFQTQAIGSVNELRWFLDAILLNDVFEIKYDISCDRAGQPKAHFTKQMDPTNYSRIYYQDNQGRIMEQGFSDTSIYVLTTTHSDLSKSGLVPSQLSLNALPNPFKSEIRLGILVPEQIGEISLNIYSIDGRLIESIRNGKIKPGNHIFTWNGESKNASSGLYIASLKTGNKAITRPIVLLR